MLESFSDCLTRYGIEGIAQTYEDPFGVAKIDINMDDIVEDARREVEVMILAWQSQGSRGGMFRPYPRDGITSETSSEIFSNEGSESELRVVVSDLGHQIQADAAERERRRMARVPITSNAREIKRSLGSEGRQLSNMEEGSPLLRSVLDPRKDSGGAISPGTFVVGADYMSINNGQGRLDAGDSSVPRISWSDGKAGKSSV
jgi:putative membrane protein